MTYTRYITAQLFQAIHISADRVIGRGFRKIYERIFFLSRKEIGNLEI